MLEHWKRSPLRTGAFGALLLFLTPSPSPKENEPNSGIHPESESRPEATKAEAKRSPASPCLPSRCLWSFWISCTFRRNHRLQHSSLVGAGRLGQCSTAGPWGQTSAAESDAKDRKGARSYWKPWKILEFFKKPTIYNTSTWNHCFRKYLKHKDNNHHPKLNPLGPSSSLPWTLQGIESRFKLRAGLLLASPWTAKKSLFESSAACGGWLTFLFPCYWEKHEKNTQMKGYFLVTTTVSLYFFSSLFCYFLWIW